jgi:hypothetical protein
VIGTKVIEFCFETADGALVVATELVRSRPDAVSNVLTRSNLEDNTSVLHVIVPEEKVDTFIRSRTLILGHTGNVLVSAESPVI